MVLADDFVEGFMNNIPIIGHVKGVLHLMDGDKEKGKEVLCQATRTVVVATVAAATAGIFRQPALGALSGFSTGLVFDGAHSLVVQSPRGSIKLYVNAYNDFTGKNILKAILLPVFDATTGLAISFPAIYVAKNGITATVETILATCDKHPKIVTFTVTIVVSMIKGCLPQNNSSSGNCGGADDATNQDEANESSSSNSSYTDHPGPSSEPSTPRPQETRNVFNYTANCNCISEGNHCAHVDAFIQQVQHGLTAQPQ